MATIIGITSRLGPNPLLVGGIATEAFLAFGMMNQVGIVRGASHKTASPIYLVAVLILWMSSKNVFDWYLHAAMGTLVAVPLALFIWQEFFYGEGLALRRARRLIRRVAKKTDWPTELPACKELPEVKALRNALREDVEPGLLLLDHPKPQVRLVILAALESCPAWREGQAESVLRCAKVAGESPVRVAALLALANVDDSHLTDLMAVYLRDAAAEVRKAAAEALLTDTGRRWPHIREHLRTALLDTRLAEDGPLPVVQALPTPAITDLMMWSAEKGPIGLRATLTLLAHYRRELNQNPSMELIDELSGRIRDPRVHSSLRVEYARLLAEGEYIDGRLWNELLKPSQPSYLRLLAAGALLRDGDNEATLETLRDVARVPNREIALQVASILQKVLRIDMGLPIGGKLPKPHSKAAAEIARRVVDWSNGKETTSLKERSSRRSRLLTFERELLHASSDHVPFLDL